MPPDVAEWYAAMPFALQADLALALPGVEGVLMHPFSPDFPEYETDPGFARYRALGRFPLQPLFSHG